MNDKDLEIEYLKKIDLFQTYNKHYYDKDKPIVSDQKFDFFKKRYNRFREKI
jgi:DNA ligase (NAD+)